MPATIQEQNRPARKHTIAGGGLIGLLRAYFAWKDAQEKNDTLRVTVFDTAPRNASCYFGAPHITPQELFSVMPPGKEFIASLKKHFRDVGVDNPAGLHESPEAKKYIADVIKFINGGTQDKLIDSLEALGEYSMALWRELYETGDADLKKVFDAADFSPCAIAGHAKSNTLKLRNGYEIQQFTNRPGVAKALEKEVDYHQKRGYSDTQLLSSDELLLIDPSYKNFVDTHSIIREGKKVWRDDTAILWRPAGYLNAAKFLPLFEKYLEEKMGEYVNEQGEIKKCFRLKQGEVTQLIYDKSDAQKVDDVKVVRKESKESHRKKYRDEAFSICSGEKIETLQNLELQSPSSAIFGGATLQLAIDLNKLTPTQQEMLKKIPKKNIAFRSEGGFTSVSQWLGVDENNIFGIRIAGGKAFYGKERPGTNDGFVAYANIRQLNEINKAHPEVFSILLQRNTKGNVITRSDFFYLLDNGSLTYHECSRAATFDGAPIAGAAYNRNGRVKNLNIVAGFNGGGVSVGPGMVALATRNAGLFRASCHNQSKIMDAASSCRMPLTSHM